MTKLEIKKEIIDNLNNEEYPLTIKQLYNIFGGYFSPEEIKHVIKELSQEKSVCYVKAYKILKETDRLR
ncbi:MAG: hypothetical protein ABSB10_09990 [Candidatus Bathyarchaeia archaeon]|jgi:UDP:flavonoid glycosyltransferase YjiC (YdhE family)